MGGMHFHYAAAFSTGCKWSSRCGTARRDALNEEIRVADSYSRCDGLWRDKKAQQARNDRIQLTISASVFFRTGNQ